jgi:hypothetical protein
LPSGRIDNISAVDIGRWSAGIAGIITNTGTVGFVTSEDFTGGPLTHYRVGGLQTTTQIGPLAFNFNFLPTISGGFAPPHISFGLAPNMTAANTPFAPFTPPTPGIVQPNGGLPVPPTVAALSAPAPAVAADEPPASSTLAALDGGANDVAARNAVDETTAPEAPATEAPAVTPDTSVTAEEPAVVIPGVNGAPLNKPSTTSPSGSGGGKPFQPFKPFTDAISNGIGALTGNRFAAPGGAGSPGGADAGSATGTGTGSESGQDAGSDAS